ncbi:DUF2288 domain-containing protein [Geobacter sp. SVR]|uniref:DUF2288 domain-containing protein n=1 Tax=Geobacter sp. SVR TaxID=2495594 RepID=UPI00143EFF78|nr:DUF2288 domain-containing protein [Geobacter sp. SVR]BCS55515.1 hypothetical protein GSVR_38230 [Geobacter sp. SVR]GCF83518.1 hypothetical protein GSbR_01180 [Geobacter sp. SVR]
MTTKEEILQTIDEAEWSWLRAHLERGGLIAVDGSLELAEVALKIAGDDAGIIGRWIDGGLIGKPSAAQIEAWDTETTKRFDAVIVSPYVLIQERKVS